MDPDSALEKLGDPWTSRWTIGALTLLVLTRGFCSAWHSTALVFLGAEPDHHCRLPEGVSLNQSVPLVTDNTGQLVYDQCHVYVNYTPASNLTETCPDGWEYDTSFHNMVHEWDLVCDRDYFTEMWQSCFNAGTMVGSLFQGAVIDRMGRKPVFLFNVFVLCTITFISAWVTNFYVYLGIKFASGIALQGSNVAGLVLACEMFQAKQRTVACTACNCSWGFAMLVYALMAYYLREWRHLVIATALPVALIIPACYFLQESIPWLLVKNRVDRVNVILKKICRWNGRVLKEPTPTAKALLPLPEIVHIGTSEPNAVNGGVLLPQNTPPPLSSRPDKFLYANLLRETLMKEASQSLPELAAPLQKDDGLRLPSEDDQHDTLSSMPALNNFAPNPAKTRTYVDDVTMSVDSLHISTINVNKPESAVVIKREGLLLSVTSLNKEEVDEGQSTTCRDSQLVALMMSSRYRMYTYVISYALCAVSLGYHGLSLAVDNLAGNLFTNYALMGLVEIPSYLMVPVLSRCVGRKPILCCCFVMGGLLLWLTLIAFHLAEPETAGVINTVLSMTGKGFLSVGFGLLPQYTMEIFPTTVRSQALGIVFFSGRIGTLIAPFSLYLGKMMIWLPAVVLGTTTLTSGLLMLLLPETRGQPLLQSTEDAERFFNEEEKRQKEAKTLKEEAKREAKLNREAQRL